MKRVPMNLEHIVNTFVNAAPPFDDVLKEHLSIALYRLLARGEPVTREALGDSIEADVPTVDRIIARWPEVFFDRQNCIVGYRGLSIASAYDSPHVLVTRGRRLSAWCAWDTLFLPELLGEAAEIESTTPDGGMVRLSMTPNGIQRVEPADATMSFLLPDTNFAQDVVATFCHFIYFFRSREAGESWVAGNPRTFLLSLVDAYYLARRKNAMQYPTIFGIRV